jgi:hypothetical protein
MQFSQLKGVVGRASHLQVPAHFTEPGFFTLFANKRVIIIVALIKTTLTGSLYEIIPFLRCLDSKTVFAPGSGLKKGNFGHLLNLQSHWDNRSKKSEKKTKSN